MKKRIYIIGAIVAIIAIGCIIFIPTEGKKLSKARELKLNNKFEEAFKIYQELSEEGSAEGKYYLADLYNGGRGVEQSDSLAWKYYQQSAELGFDDAKARVACAYFYGWYEQKRDEEKGYEMLKKLYESSKSDYAKALYADLYFDGDNFVEDDKEKFDEIMSTLTESTDPYALCLVGSMYGSGEKTDGDKAIEYWTKAYENGYGFSAYNLARVYLYGWYNKTIDKEQGIEWLKKGIERLSTDCMLKYGDICMDDSKENKEYYDPSIGISMYKKAAKQNDADACDRLGYMYSFGKFVEKDDEQATNYFKLADRYGSANGSLNLGTSYLAGRGIEQDVKNAESCYKRAVDRGSSEAAMRLAECYANGNFGYDIKKYKTYLNKAVQLGSPRASFKMAEIYYYGNSELGFKEDNFQAFVYAKKAADAGWIEACEFISNLYKQGIGCEKDLSKAKEYHDKASM